VAQAYDSGALRVKELARDEARKARLAQLRAALLDGPVLRLPFKGARYQFNPQTLVPIEGVGTVFPTFQTSAPWGVLEMDAGGALLTKDKAEVVVTAVEFDSKALTGKGWRLRLKDGWEVRPGLRGGDWMLVHITP
jgi:hypothetical protein